MKNFNKIIFSIILLLLLMLTIIPVSSFAADPASKGLVPCTNTPDANGKVADPCNFNSFLSLINKLIRFLLFDMAVPIAALMFFYAGFLMVTSGGSGEKLSKAKSIFTNVALGLIIVIASWLVIHTILVILGYQGSWIGF